MSVESSVGGSVLFPSLPRYPATFQPLQQRNGRIPSLGPPSCNGPSAAEALLPEHDLAAIPASIRAPRNSLISSPALTTASTKAHFQHTRRLRPVPESPAIPFAASPRAVQIFARRFLAPAPANTSAVSTAITA